MSEQADRHHSARASMRLSAFGTGIGERMALAGLGMALIWLGVWWALS